VAMGRGNSSQPSSTQFIAVDLAHPSQVAAAASVLAGQWYSGSKSSSSQSLPGLDIVINNAGVFTGAPPGASICSLVLHNFFTQNLVFFFIQSVGAGLIWATNSHAPILISRAITEVISYSCQRPFHSCDTVFVSSCRHGSQQTCSAVQIRVLYALSRLAAGWRRVPA
jgi:NAD(P)-dependent dehydrogenase (short-subunit alcohol dehydrogenase family)